MIIGVPTYDKENVAEHFGRTKYLLLINTETKESKVVENKHDEKLPALVLKENNVNEIIVSGIGYKALELLKKFRIKALKARYDNIEENIKHINELEEFNSNEGCEGEHHEHHTDNQIK